LHTDDDDLDDSFILKDNVSENNDITPTDVHNVQQVFSQQKEELQQEEEAWHENRSPLRKSADNGLFNGHPKLCPALPASSQFKKNMHGVSLGRHVL
jgi:hypothetical protein